MLWWLELAFGASAINVAVSVAGNNVIALILTPQKAMRLLKISSAILNDAIYSDNDMESVMSNETLEEIMCTYSFSNVSDDGLAWIH